MTEPCTLARAERHGLWFARRVAMSLPQIDQADFQQAARLGWAVGLCSYRPDRGRTRDSWLFLCVRRQLLRELRFWTERGVTRTVEEVPDQGAGPERTAVARAFVQALLAKLHGRERDVLALRYLEGLSQVETARRLGIAQSKVSEAEGRAVRRLREEIQ